MVGRVRGGEEMGKAEAQQRVCRNPAVLCSTARDVRWTRGRKRGGLGG